MNATVLNFPKLDMSDPNCGFSDAELLSLIDLMRAEMLPQEIKQIELIEITSRDNDVEFGEYAVFMIASRFNDWVENFCATVFFTSPKESELVCLTNR